MWPFKRRVRTVSDAVSLQEPGAAEIISLCDDGRVSVVGESYYQGNIRRAAEGRAAGYGFDEHLQATALLVPEPSNRYDANAVRVDLMTPGGPVTAGYLAAEHAPPYQRVLLDLARSGRAGCCPARITGGGQKHYGVYLHVSEPQFLLTGKRKWSPDGRLNAEWTTAVTREGDHQEWLLRYCAKEASSPVNAIAELGFCQATKGKYAGTTVIEVYLDGQRIGELTRAMSDRYTRIVSEVLAAGLTPSCEAIVTPTPKQTLEVQLLMPRP